MSDKEPNEAQRLLAELNALLRLKTTVIGMKLFETVEEMEAIPRIRRPKTMHTTDQIVSHGVARSAGRSASRRRTWSARSAGP